MEPPPDSTIPIQGSDESGQTSNFTPTLNSLPTSGSDPQTRVERRRVTFARGDDMIMHGTHEEVSSLLEHSQQPQPEPIPSPFLTTSMLSELTHPIPPQLEIPAEENQRRADLSLGVGTDGSDELINENEEDIPPSPNRLTAEEWRREWTSQMEIEEGSEENSETINDRESVDISDQQTISGSFNIILTSIGAINQSSVPPGVVVTVVEVEGNDHQQDEPNVPSDIQTPDLLREAANLGNPTTNLRNLIFNEPTSTDISFAPLTPRVLRRGGRVMLADMNADIQRYSRQREQAFYQQNCYGLNRLLEPEPEGVSTPITPQRRRRNSSPPSVRPRTRRRVSQIISERPFREPLPVPVVPDPSYNFVQHLIDGAPRHRLNDRNQFPEPGIHHDFARYQYSLVSLPSENQEEDTEKRMVEARARAEIRAFSTQMPSDLGQGMNLICSILERAIADSMPAREALEFLRQWHLFWSNVGRNERYSDPLSRRIPMAVIQFWTALRRGWGYWEPSENMLLRIRGALVRETVIDHDFWEMSIGEIDRQAQGARYEVLLEQYHIEQFERDRFSVLARHNGGLRIQRLLRVLMNWILIEPGIEAFRRPEESRLSREELRLDRLERLIREEAFVNAERSVVYQN